MVHIKSYNGLIVCVVLSVCFQHVSSSYSDLTYLETDVQTMDMIPDQVQELIRSQLKARCSLQRWTILAHDYVLTMEDLDILQHCPLKEFYLMDTACLSAAVSDLSVLSQLTHLTLRNCNNLNFTISGLPATLEVLDIVSLEMRNVEVNYIASGFGNSLSSLRVMSPVMCCEQSMLQMFGKILPHDLDCSTDAGWACGLSKDGTTLNIQELHHVVNLTDQVEKNCSLVGFRANAEGFTLTQTHLDILKDCPLDTLTIGGFTCFTSMDVDLSELSNLRHLTVMNCDHNDFVIKTLPPSLVILNIDGLQMDNVQLESHNGSEFGEHLQLLYVTHTASQSLCCQEKLHRMFGTSLPGVDCQTLVDEGTGWACGLSKDGSTLNIDTEVQVDLLRYHQQPNTTCRLKKIRIHVYDFVLTQHDIDSLEHCPLTTLELFNPTCLSDSVAYFSGLSLLKRLILPTCKINDFVIERLPVSLSQLGMVGLEIRNFKLKNDSALQFSDSMKVAVSNPTMCCPSVTSHMFGVGIPEDNCFVGKIGGDWAVPVGTISSCNDLIGKPALRLLVWFMALVAFCGNLLVIIYRVVWDRKSLGKSHGIFVLNLSVSDLLMGIYLMVIAGADSRFRGQYAMWDTDWRHGRLCQFGGVITTWSSEASAMFVLLITMDRFLAIQFPFGNYHTSPRTCRIMCSIVWLVCGLLAVTPLMMPEWEIYSFNSICVGLPLNIESYPGSSYAAVTFLGINSVIFILIAIGQVSIYRAKWVSDSKVKSSMVGDQARRRYKEDIAIARHLSMIVLTDFCCWFPICVMGLMARGGHFVSNDVYAWAAVVILPINSAINPLLYTLPSLKHSVTQVIATHCRHNTHDTKTRSGGSTSRGDTLKESVNSSEAKTR